MESRADRIRRTSKQTCQHFTGVQNECCEAGINYVALTGGVRQGHARKLPCLGEKPNETHVSCERYEPLTPAQIEERIRALDRSLERFVQVGPLIVDMKSRYQGKSGRERFDCPCCGGSLRISISGYNGHTWGDCETPGCVNWME